MVKVKPHELRKKDNSALEKQLLELRTELAQLRVV
jgi:large subunit ribosomal protein L35e